MRPSHRRRLMTPAALTQHPSPNQDPSLKEYRLVGTAAWADASPADVARKKCASSGQPPPGRSFTSAPTRRTRRRGGVAADEPSRDRRSWSGASKALANGEEKRARELQRVLLASYNVKLAAAYEAVRNQKDIGHW